MASPEQPHGTVKGMNDLLSPEVAKWQYVEERARGVLEAFAFRELRTPILEYTPLFSRAAGETTEVVEKQMYTFEDRDGQSVTMRPEGTAPAVRAYVNRAQWNREPVTRWYYMGPMFRHERQQRGRLRQFHQIGAEVFGLAGPTADAELVGMLAGLFGELGLAAASLEIAINTLGQPGERAAYQEALRAYFGSRRDELDPDSVRRIDTNPMRIFDSKEERTQKVVAGAPLLFDHLGEASRRHFEAVRGLLAALGTNSVHDPRLVRGFDYYTGTIFEIKAQVGNLGAQNTICGGGRYDRLVAELGGPEVPALGFGIGLERVLLAMTEEAESFEPPPALFIAPLDERARTWALPVAHRLRMAGVRVELEHRDVRLGNQLKRADKLKARLALIVGENELASGKLALKDLGSGQQHEVTEPELQARVQALLD
jgi:histidyl-tRNA synthetase